MAKAKMLQPGELAAALADVDRNSRYPQRDRVALLLSHRAGLRAAEISGLDWCHVLTADGNTVAPALDVPASIAKLHRARTIPVHAELREALDALRSNDIEGSHGSQPVIRSERGRMTPNSMVHWFLRIYARAGLTGASSHSGRRTLLTTLARTCTTHGGSLRDVQIIAGHSDLLTTQTYLEGSAEAQRRMVTA